MVRSTILTAIAATLLGQVANATYNLDTVFDASNFFQEFTHFNQPDPTQGFVEYVDLPTAQNAGLSAIRQDGTIYMGVDTTTYNPPNGRRSVRVESQKTFTKGLFIADIAHMPSNTCGVWPAFWTFGPNWPVSGEIDIIEGVNTQTENSITLHTKNKCQMLGHSTLASTFVVSEECNALTGCGQQSGDNQNYGDGFNAIGGGVYAMEWTDARIAIWFFPRHSIPNDITSGNPAPSGWGQPSGSFSPGQTCDITSAFKDHKIVFDTTFCGNWAGEVWASNAECSAHGPSCKDYVASNPKDFAEAYWSINSVKVYKAQPI
ncbi:Concanavalin A-like lectin/glucanase [Cordyceps fumosorosea ARSEF 2679]|uniref:endo-1,3(4)-beta-glucanase n=1 Tax=Cordyceps fumosorosea (strain ARSEF 2679) TaxID=1081104 RepID=A0A167ZGX8_CORFA|nr:Concanavalin A-like lectin/glucanase [Cordyceps fumosorosea ARSEF 2679]OAA67501.1 Concanavalin A-like lectin/glucanase [Cordyceps fumosorosea ARSEF 2679]